MCNLSMRGPGGWVTAVPRVESWCDPQDGRETKLMLVDDFGVWGDLIYACGVGRSGLRF